MRSSDDPSPCRRPADAASRRSALRRGAGGARRAPASLCRTGEHIFGHPVRRQVERVDRDGQQNAGLGRAVRDAVDAIDTSLAAGRDVVVHHHGGRNRTRLVSKAWRMRADRVSERAVHAWRADRWQRHDDDNESFVEFLRVHW